MNLMEFTQAGGQVGMFGRPLLELSPRQLRFLFATGAFGAGKAAARAIRQTPGTLAHDQPGSGRASIRAAAKQAMQQQLRGYKAMKSVTVPLMKNLAAQVRGRPGVLPYGRTAAAQAGRLIARDRMRASVK